MRVLTLRKILVAFTIITGLCVADAQAAITATPSSVSAFPTQSTQPVSLALTFGPGANGAPGTLSAAGVPAGTTTVPNPVSYTPAAGGGGASTSFSFSVGASTPPGTYPVTLRDNTNASGSATVTLVVNTPGFTASAAPNPVTLTIGGGSQQVTVSTVTDPGFNAATIAYSFSGFPAFITNNGPQTTTVTGNYSPVPFTFSLGAGATAGTYTGTLAGTLPSGAQKTFPFTVVVQQPDINAAFTQPVVSMCNGQTVNDSVQLAPLNNYSGSPSLTFTSTPAGVTLSAPSSVKLPPAQSVPFTITASAAASSGIAVLNISDPAAGINKNIQLQINITPANYTAGVSPASVTLTAGGSAQNLVASIIANACFSSDVAVSAIAPPEITLTPNPATLLAPRFAPATISIRASSAAAAGSYPLTFTFSGGGVTRTATVQVTVSAAPDFVLVLNPPSLSIPAGSSAPTTVSIRPVNNFNGTVNVSIAPAQGLTFSRSTFTLTAASSETITIAVASDAPQGTVPVVFTGTSNGVLGSRSATLQVNVGGPPGFVFTVSPDTLTLPAGGTTTVTASVTGGNGFTGTVSVTAPSVPGVTFSPSAFSLTPGNSQTVTVTVDPAAASGPRGAQLFQATSPGVSPQSAPLNITVSARPDFTLSVTPPSVTIRPGESTTVTVSATGADLTGPITVTASPAVALQIAPVTFRLTPGGSQTVTISPSGAGSALGPIQVTFTGTAAGAPSHDATLVVTLRAAGPRLTSAVPPALVIGTLSTIVRVAGDFLQPGAQFHASDPSLVIESANVLTSQLADVRMTVRNGAAPGPRTITVTNPDGATSNALTLLVYPSTSIGAPLDVLAAAVVYPAQGTFVTPNETLYPRALLATSGTGTISGIWQFDGAPYDRFIVNATGGMPVEVRANMPLPASFNGSHTLALVIERPRKFVSAAIDIVGAADRVSRLTLLAPRDGAVIRGAAQLFRWSLVPNCSGYDVEVAPPDADAPIARFHVAEAEWKPAAADVAAIGAGVHRWRVRPRCAGETDIEPTAWQRFAILPAHINLSLQPSTTNAKGATVLHWQGGVTGVLYRVEFLSPSGETIFSALTAASEYVVPRSFAAGTVVRVSALGPDGAVLGTSTSSPLSRRRERDAYQLAQETLIELGQVEPAEGAVITTTQPHIAVQWKGAAPADQVMLLVDNVDVTQVAKIAATSAAYDSLIALAPGEHSAAIAVAGNIRRWTFIVAGEGGAAPSAPKQPRGDWVVAPIGSITLMREGNTHEARAQLSALTDLNASSITNKATGDLSLKHDIKNNKTSQESRNWVTEFGAQQQPAASESARAGFAPPLFLDQAQLMSAGLPRGGIEAKAAIPVGSLSVYQTFTSQPAGVVSGLFGPDQRIQAAAFQTPFNQKYDFRLIGMRVDESPGLNSTGGKGRTLGFFGRYTLGTTVNAIVEAARGDFDPVAGGLETRRKGSAGRIGVNGLRGTFNYALNLRRTQADFVNPANRGFTPAGVPDRTGGDLMVSKLFGTTAISAQLHHQHDGTTSGLTLPRAKENGGMASLVRPLGTRVSLSLTGNYTKDAGESKPDIGLPRTDRALSGGTATLSEVLGRLFVSQTVSRQDMRDRVNSLADSTTTMASVMTGGQITKILYLSAILSGTRLESSPTVGVTDQYLATLQPIVSVPFLFLTFQPRASYSTSKNDLFASTSIEQYQALATFAPQWFQSIFSLQLSGDWTRAKSGFIGVPSPFVHRYVASFNLHWREGAGPAFVQGLLMPAVQPVGAPNPAMSMPGMPH